ncbi:hypothetical protein ACYSNO_04320 [Enterococcus sp. LJL98]
MHYELVNTINPNSEVWKKQKERLLLKQGQVLSISPSPNFNRLKNREGVTGINVIDEVTKRKHDASQFLFFNQVSTATRAEIFVNGNWTISLNHDGEEIGQMKLYPETRRLVKEVEYFNLDGTTDFIVEYADDGAPFSHIFFANNRPEQIDFFNSEQLPILSYFFYEGQNNFAVQRDPQTLKVVKKFANTMDFIMDQVAQKVTAEDTVVISYMGIELSALKRTNSYNILSLEETPIDEQGNVKRNLVDILENKIECIQEVRMQSDYFEQLKAREVPLNKIVVCEK